ncbi:MAG TPA: phosphoenolpyruvate carboxylase [archaeon]|nr:phosphoenolpyruvate carboxylase [archaeon]
MKKIPKTMSTQHPDNVRLPFFAESPELGGEDEIQEAYYAFSHLGCTEQMWDSEGKEVDNFVVKKLLTKYESFFKEKVLGEDVFLTMRVPNPDVEKAEAKILLETLESIPRSFDAAKLVYGRDVSPIFEVILPMCQSAESADLVYKYYKNFVAGKQNKELNGSGKKISDWIGVFRPETINVIPLFEDREQFLNVDNITKEYLSDKDLESQRVFLARSDPALNYGSLSAVLFNKIALQKLQNVEEETGVKIYPIIGVGSAPFRGNMRPQTAERVAKGYSSVHTFSIQSSFKYDNEPHDVENAVKILNERTKSKQKEFDQKKAMKIVDKYSAEYRKEIVKLAPVINDLAKFVPERRKRKLHIGLFGYSRELKGIFLPRAIKFAAALYSIGVPPEILGLNALSASEFEELREFYPNIELDLRDALVYYNDSSPLLSDELKKKVKELFKDFEVNIDHRKFTSNAFKAFKEKNYTSLKENIMRAADKRGFLG